MLFPREHPADTRALESDMSGFESQLFCSVKPGPASCRVTWELEAHASVVFRLNELVAPTFCKGPEHRWLHSGPESVTIEKQGGV